VTGGSW